ncbi:MULTISPECIES: hypothetical protein [Bacillus cereus group]|uniref:hypothetical protein n=1 Tax=Bacillus cereus group TaxID=86661 RepID=UPI001F57B174|nr:MULTISPECIES: hypothetical protein [Bacillus cereus group]HDR7922270.1 hypothetical protein [Bacillus paranthracis]
MKRTEYHYALFVLNREKQALENKIEEIKVGLIYSSEKRRKLAILMHEEDLKSLKRAIEQLERATR